MKRGATVRIIIWSVITILLIGGMVVGIVFSSLSGTFLSGGWSIGFGGVTYSDADAYSIGSASLTDQIDRLTIQWTCGSVTVAAYDGDTIEIKETAVQDRNDELRYLVRNGRLTIHYRKSAVWFGIFVRKPEKDLTVLLPQEIAAGLRSVNIDTVSAGVSVSALSVAGALKTETVSGSVTVRDVTARKLACDTVSGTTTAENVTIDELSFAAVSGSCIVQGAVDEAEFDSTSGNFELNSAVTPREIETDTVSGDVKLIIPETSGFTAEYDSISGDFNCDYSFKKHGDRYICGDGSADFSFDSVSGDASLKINRRPIAPQRASDACLFK